uniref:Skp1_POZ domain-containing protein n=1 Tax=Steinernema glaseri TaxID=37863 RepID=A0A1I7Y192_9BILA
MLTDLGFTEDALPDEAIPMPTVNGDALEAIIKWLRMHEEEEPKTEDCRQEHRLNRIVVQEDVEFLDSLTPRTRLADVINAAYFL